MGHFEEQLRPDQVILKIPDPSVVNAEILRAMDELLLGTQPGSTLSATPYSDVIKIRRRCSYIRRPVNAFMIWSGMQRRVFNELNPGVRGVPYQRVISQILGRQWNAMSEEVKKPFFDYARCLSLLHAIEFPKYEYRPNIKQLLNPPRRPRIIKRKIASLFVSPGEPVAKVSTPSKVCSNNETPSKKIEHNASGQMIVVAKKPRRKQAIQPRNTNRDAHHRSSVSGPGCSPFNSIRIITAPIQCLESRLTGCRLTIIDNDYVQSLDAIVDSGVKCSGGGLIN